MNSDVSRLIIHKNRRLPGYKTLKSGKKIMGVTSTLTLPSKLLAFGERFQWVANYLKVNELWIKIVFLRGAAAED